jgi:predicted metal-dependent hydrolase
MLEQSFKRCNALYFDGLLAQPNLVWGGYNLRLLGTYTYATDTIMISQVLRTDENLLDYVMHHEMLHKKHKFNHTSSRTHSHTKAFREDEAKFHDKDAEKKLRVFLSRPRRIHQKSDFVRKIMDWL